MFIMLNIMALVDKKLLKDLTFIDKNKSSYHYLKSFEEWMDKKSKINIMVAKIFYPIAFLSVIFGVGLMKIKGTTIGAKLVEEWVFEFPDTQLFFGTPWPIPVVIVLGAVLLYFLGE